MLGGLLYLVGIKLSGIKLSSAYCIYLTLFNKQKCILLLDNKMDLALLLISNSGLLNLKYHTIHLIAIGATNNVAEKGRFYFAFL